MDSNCAASGIFCLKATKTGSSPMSSASPQTSCVGCGSLRPVRITRWVRARTSGVGKGCDQKVRRKKFDNNDHV